MVKKGQLEYRCEISNGCVHVGRGCGLAVVQ